MSQKTKHCLLIVDDEPDICDSVHALLRMEFRVLRAGSAAEGVRMMQENDVHIIMTDQRMPKVTGVELLSKTRDRFPLAVRMLFTGYADFESLSAAINDGRVFQFLRKPWRPEELLSAVRDAAAEFERLVEKEQLILKLQEEIRGLKERVAALEHRPTRCMNATPCPQGPGDGGAEEAAASASP